MQYSNMYMHSRRNIGCYISIITTIVVITIIIIIIVTITVIDTVMTNILLSNTNYQDK